MYEVKLNNQSTDMLLTISFLCKSELRAKCVF